MKYTETKTWQDTTKAECDGDRHLYMDCKKITDKEETIINDFLELLTTNCNKAMIANQVNHCIQTQHRTHQQSIIRNIHNVLELYGYASHDLRNESAVQWAKQVTKEKTYFTFI